MLKTLFNDIKYSTDGAYLYATAKDKYLAWQPNADMDAYNNFIQDELLDVRNKAMLCNENYFIEKDNHTAQYEYHEFSDVITRYTIKSQGSFCNDCDGQGILDEDEIEDLESDSKCHECDGDGEVVIDGETDYNHYSVETECKSCDGSGKSKNYEFDEDGKCIYCNGDGEIFELDINTKYSGHFIRMLVPKSIVAIIEYLSNDMHKDKLLAYWHGGFKALFIKFGDINIRITGRLV